MGWQYDAEDSEYCGSEWDGKRYLSAGQGGAEQYRRTFWDLSDSGKRCGAEHLVIGCFGRRCNGAGIYYHDRTMYGKPGCGAADFYFKKLTKITLLISTVWNVFIFLLTPLFMRAYALEPETKQLVIWLVLIHNIFNAAAFPFSGALSNGLRAAGDVKFTMYVSIASTIAGRLFLSYVLGIVFDMGVIGIAVAMVCDWIIRAVIFYLRQKSGKWKEFQVI